LQSGVIISNNRCYNNCKTGYVAGNIADIYIDLSTGVTVTGNNLSANGNSGGRVAGIFLGPTLSHVGIFGNQIYNTGQGRTDGAGIWNGGANYVFASGNYIYDTQATHTMSQSMAGNAGTHNVYIENYSDLPSGLALQSDTLLVGPNQSDNSWGVTGHGIRYNGSNAIAFGWTGSAASVSVDGVSEGTLITSTNAHALTLTWGTSNVVQLMVDNTAEGNVMTDIYMASRPNAANDAAAAALGVPVSGTYRNGSVLMVRIV
jgi:hypothetical protein